MAQPIPIAMTDFGGFVLLGLVLCLGIFIQAASGFAAGLLIISALVWVGYSIPEAQASLLVATVPQNLWSVWLLRDSIEPRRIAWPAIGRIACLPLGIIALTELESYSMDSIKQVVGGVMLAVTLAIIWVRPMPRAGLHWGWAWLAFPLSGFLQGLVGMGGPAMVLWVQAHDWDTWRSRGFMFAMYSVSLIPALGLLVYAFGNRVTGPALFSAAMTPLLLVATSLGIQAGTRLGQHRLRRVTLGLLLILGALSLASPMLPSANRPRWTEGPRNVSNQGSTAIEPPGSDNRPDGLP